MTRRTTTAASTMIGGIDLAGQLASGMAAAKVGEAASLVMRTSRQRETANLAGGTRTKETRVPCRGIRDEVAKDGARVVTVTLFGASIVLAGERVIPLQGDAVTIRGETFEIVAVEDDPAAGAYVCTCSAIGTGPR